MKKIILYILIPLFLFTLSGCNFLRGGEEEPYMEDEMMEEGLDEDSEEFLIEDEEFGESSGEEGGFGEDMEGDFGSEDFAELDEEGDFEDEEEFEEEGEKKGFFSRLFSRGKDEDEKSEEDYEEGDFDSEDSFSEESFVEEESFEESTSDTMTETSTETETQVTTVTEMAEEQTTVVETTRKPLNKILEFAYNKSGFLVNAVYIARPNEDLQSISQKIYEQDRTGDLLAINTHLQGRNVVVGDKIYYNSPNRPGDNRRILFYYEDNNQSPSYYNVSEGENIRDVAYKLLGHSNSWKEIWATNPELESKGEIQGSVRIAYWDGGSVPQVKAPQPETPDTFAQNEMPTQNENFQPPNTNLPESGLNNLDSELSPSAELDQQKAKNPFPIENPQPEEQNQRDSGNDILSKLLENITLIGVVIAFFIIISLILRIVFKKRKQRDFDYTSV